MTTTGRAPSIRDDLRSAITQAMRRRDRRALAVYRSALSAIDNAEAVALGPSDQASAIEASEAGVGRTEAPRRLVTEQEMINIVSGEAAERRGTADTLTGVNDAAAQQLHNEAHLLLELVDHAARRSRQLAMTGQTAHAQTGEQTVDIVQRAVR